MSTAALTCARAARRAALPRHLSRSITTEATGSSLPADGPVFAPRGRPPRSRRLESVQSVKEYKGKSVYVRSWDAIKNMPEFFAMLRGVEKKFGRVREFRIGRDADISTSYPQFFVLEFAEDEAFERVAKSGVNIKVEVPVINTNQPGGIGLAELQGLLDSQDRDPALDTSGLYGAAIPTLSATTEASEERQTKVVELIVQPAKTGMIEARQQRDPRRNLGFGVRFHQWGGFYQPEGPDARPVSYHMTRTLEKWAPLAHARPSGASAQAAPAAEDRSTSHENAPWTEFASTFSQTAARLSDADPLREAESQLSAVKTKATTTTKVEAEAELPEIPEEVVQAASAHEDEALSPAEPSAPRLSRKQKILELARQHARTPLPDADEAPAVEEKAKTEEEAREARVQMRTVRERLLRLVSGKWS